MNPKLLQALRAAVAVAVIAVAAPVVGGILRAPAAAAAAVSLPSPVMDLPAAGETQIIVLAGGCFWGVQGVFQHVKGVRQAVSGYAGGKKLTASYELVSSGATGHAESVQITYDPKVISYGQILRIFFSVATDPTQLNMQYPDHGTQYRNAIFYQTADQKRIAEAYIAQLDRAKAFPKAVVTRLEPNTGFFAAEGYHQNYLTLHPDQPYIATYDLPKVEDLKRLFPDRYSAKPALVG